MQIINPAEPWVRIKEPLGIPGEVTASWIRLLSDEEFGLLLASNLLPKDDVAAFRTLWALIAYNDDLAQRAFDQMEVWLDACEDNPEAPRAKKFYSLLDTMWNELVKIRDTDLVQDPVKVPVGGTTLTARLVQVIEYHRSAIAALGIEPSAVDEALWASRSNARGKKIRPKNREDKITKYWHVGPSYTTQLAVAVKEHRSGLSRPVVEPDEVLWSVLGLLR